jgi:hypothetical protein
LRHLSNYVPKGARHSTGSPAQLVADHPFADDSLQVAQIVRNYFGNSGLNGGERARGGLPCTFIRIGIESRSRHFDLISGGQRPRSTDLVVTITSGILVVGFACALVASLTSTVSSLSAWVH